MLKRTNSLPKNNRQFNPLGKELSSTGNHLSKSTDNISDFTNYRDNSTNLESNAKIKRKQSNRYFKQSINSNYVKKKSNQKANNVQFCNPFQFKKPTKQTNLFQSKINSVNSKIGNSTNLMYFNPFLKSPTNPFKLDNRIDKNLVTFSNKKEIETSANVLISSKQSSSEKSFKIDLDETVVLSDSPENSPLPRRYKDTTLFSDKDIDERLNRSIEIITLD